MGDVDLNKNVFQLLQKQQKPLSSPSGGYSQNNSEEKETEYPEAKD